MKKIIFTALVSSLLSVSISSHAANPEPVIYGSVMSSSGETVTGTIRWDDEESFLSDIFNGQKIAAAGIEHLNTDEKDQLLDHQPGPQARIGGFQITFKSLFDKEIESPYFNVFFGSIKKIDVAGDVVVATLHDGTKIISTEGSNDLDAEVFVKTAEGDVKSFDLQDLKSVNFSQAPTNAKPFAEGIYGTITSSMGTFQGRVMWDKDERNTEMKLDGNDEKREYSIKFSEIVSIEKAEAGGASKVVLLDGQTLLLKGTNDVNNSNRGIWLDHPDLGRVEIAWSQFEKLVIEDIDVKWHDFSDYQNMSRKLSGTVVLKDGTAVQADALSYDMNQQSSAELLEAEIAGSTRLVLLAKYKSLTHIDDNSVELESHDSQKTMAFNERSVSRDNNGIVITHGDQHKWYPWSEIQSVTFN